MTGAARLLGHSRADERRLARAELSFAEGQFAAEREELLQERMREVGREPSVLIGTSAAGTEVRVPVRSLDSAHSEWSGGTGSGKSFLLVSMFDQLVGEMLRGARVAIVFIVMQGFAGDHLLGAIGRRLLGASAEARARILRQLHVYRVFRGGRFLTPFSLTAPEPGVSSVEQGGAYAEVIEQMAAARMGGRQELSVARILAAAIDLRIPLPGLPLALTRPDDFARRAAALPNPALQSYFPERFLRESQAGRDGILSRLDTILKVRDIRLLLSGTERMPTEEMLSPGSITLIDLGGPPLAFEGARTLGALILQLFGFAVFNPARRREGFAVLVGDELQQAITPVSTRVIDAFVTTGRAHHVGFGICHQHTEQLSRELNELLTQNVRYRYAFRMSRAESGRLAEFMPEPDATTSAHDLARRAASLPPGRFYFTDRLGEVPSPIELTAPRVEVPSLDALPADLREALERGAHGESRDVLASRLEAIERAALPPDGAPPTAPFATPDLTRRRRRS